MYSKARSHILLTVAATLQVAAGWLQAAEPPLLYWSDRVANTIRRANADGTNPELLVSGMSQARGFAADFDNDWIYFADNGTNKIQRANFDGSNVIDLVTDGLRFPAGVDLDLDNGKIYWADRDTKMIQRSNLDGTNVEDLVTGLSFPYYVRLDNENDHIYWTDFGTDKIQRSNFDGTNVVDLVTTGLDLPRGIDLDLDGGKMYWADRGTDQIQRANLDGTEIETLYTVIPPAGVDAAPHGVAVDAANGHLYWLDNGTVKLQRSNLDGSNVVDILDRSSGVLSKPWEIVLEEFAFDICADADCAPEDLSETIDYITSLILDGKFDEQVNFAEDLTINHADRDFFITGVVNTTYGDSNLDKVFNSRDLVDVFVAGEYEDDLVRNSRWKTGDWDGDFEFTSSDLVKAFEAVWIPDAQPVPEPSAIVLFAIGLIVFVRNRRRL